ncbi:extracellular solute-binding protein [Ferrovibrio terrae]|uniref:extracellular solute-binding protein n=1 Tax=Ferrovibrio terrae TaxID=2594003 RepID=UPI00313783AB
MQIDRRTMLSILAGSAMAGAFPAMAQSKEVFIATYPGSVDEGFKAVVGPQIRQKFGATSAFSPMLNTDLIGRIQASRNNPPFDVAIWDNGPIITAKQDGLLEKFSEKDSPNYASMPANLRDPDGFGPAMALTSIGIAYNPKKIKTPPTSWNDLWNPEYKGRVGIVGPASTLGTTFLIEVAKLRGGSETNVEPGFAALKELLANVGAIPPNPGALTTALSQGQVDIAPNFFNNVAALKARGADIAFAVPSSGLPLQTVTAAVIKNARNAELAQKVVDLLIDPAVQAQLEAAPWIMMPANPKVALTGFNRDVGATVGEVLKRGIFLDWTKFIASRPGWVERFNREIRV